MRIAGARIGGGLVAAALVAAACAGAGSLREAPLDAGRAMMLHAPGERVLDAARTAVREAGFEIEGERREAEAAWSLFGRVVLSDESLAARVRLVVDEVSPGRTEVRMLTRRYLPTRVGAGDPYADAIFDRLVREFLPEPPGGS